MSKIVIAAGAAAVSLAASLVAPVSAAAATKPQVTVAAATRTMTYGAATPALGYTVYGLAKGDKLLRNPTCTVPAHRNAGTYPISCSGALVNTKKYTLRYVNAALYVGRAALFVAPDYAYKYYGDAEPAFKYTTYGLVGSDKLIKTPTCTVPGAHTSAGRYALTCRGADAGSNYDLHYYDNLYDVAPRPLVVGPDANQYIYFGSPQPEFTHSALGLVDGEKLVKEPKCDVAGEHTHVGKYTITCTGAEATSNYAMTVVSNPFIVAANKSVVKGDKAAIGYNILGQPTGARLRAQLYLVYPGIRVFPGQTVTFTTGDTELCTAETDENGYATCDVGSLVGELVKNGSYTVSYAGQGKDIEGWSDSVSNT